MVACDPEASMKGIKSAGGQGWCVVEVPPSCVHTCLCMCKRDGPSPLSSMWHPVGEPTFSLLLSIVSRLRGSAPVVLLHSRFG